MRLEVFSRWRNNDVLNVWRVLRLFLVEIIYLELVWCCFYSVTLGRRLRNLLKFLRGFECLRYLVSSSSIDLRYAIVFFEKFFLTIISQL